MRIVLVSIYKPKSETGVARATDLLAKHLSKRHKILYMCAGDKHKRVENGNIAFLFLPSISLRQTFIPKLSRELIKKIYLELDNFSPNIIHAQNIVFSALVTLVWSRKRNIPYVVTLHSQPTEGIKYILPKLSSNKFLPITKLGASINYLKRFLNETDLIISLNKSIEDSIKPVKTATSTIRIPNGVELSKYSTAKISKQNNRIICSFFGMYMKRKNQEYLIKSFSHLPKNFELHLYGNLSTGKAYSKKLIIIKDNLGLNNVYIHSFIKPEKVLNKLENTNYVVSASLKEVQSIAIIEALASGTPVIGLSNETLVEVVNTENGLVLPQNSSPKEFANQLMKFHIKHSPSYSNLSKNCRQSVKRFDIKNVIHKLEKTYKRTIRNGKRKKESRVAQFIPNQLKEYLLPITERVEKKRNYRIRYYLSLTVILSLLVWPIVVFFETVKNVVNRFSGIFRKRS